MSPEELPLKDTKHVIVDSGIQLIAFQYCKNLESAKDLIIKSNLQNIETYTKKTREELEKAKPGIVDKYNAIVGKLRKLDFTFEEFQKIMEEARKVVY